MALFDSGTPLANVALSDTFNTWRVRTNQINTQAAGLASNNTFTGTNNIFNGTLQATTANFTTLQADAIDFDGDLTVDDVTANTVTSTSLVVSGLTANSVIVGGGAGSATSVSPGASGHILTSNGSAWLSQASTFLDESSNLSDLASAATALTNLGLTATAAEINVLDGVTATAAEINYNDITTLGTSEASKVVTADANGDVTLAAELKATSYNESYVAPTSSSNATTVDCEAGNSFTHTLTENTTFTFSNPPASGTSFTFSLKIVQDGSASGFTVGWPGAVDWPAATAPTLTATADAVDVFVFTTHDGGTTWYGFTAGQALA